MIYYAQTKRDGHILCGMCYHVNMVVKDLSTISGVMRRVRKQADALARPGDLIIITEHPDERPYGEGRVVGQLQY